MRAHDLQVQPIWQVWLARGRDRRMIHIPTPGMLAHYTAISRRVANPIVADHG